MSRSTNGHHDYGESDGSVHRGCRCERVLRGIETELEALREENRLLHDSASFFADLSERLNVELRQQRAQGRVDAASMTHQNG